MQRRPRLTPFGGLLLVQRVKAQGWSPASAAEALDVSRATVHKWLRRYRELGEPGLLDRNSRPPAAKVDPKLVLHYFESKEGVFLGAVDFPFDPAVSIPPLLRPGLNGLGATIHRARFSVRFMRISLQGLAIRAARSKRVDITSSGLPRCARTRS